MNGIYVSGQQMFSMPYAFPTLERTRVSKSAVYEIIGSVCLIYTVVRAFFITEEQNNPVNLAAFLFAAILRITVLTTLIIRDCLGRGKATGFLAFASYFYLFLDLMTMLYYVILIIAVFMTYKRIELIAIFYVSLIIMDFGVMCYMIINGAEWPCCKKQAQERYISAPYRPNY